QNYEDIMKNRERIPLITYNQYRKEKKKKYKNDPFNTANWKYNEEDDLVIYPNDQKLTFRHLSHRTDRYGYRREFKVYESEDCTDYPLRSLCTKAKEGNNRKIYYNQKREQQKSYTKQKLSEKETGEIYGKRKIEVEPAFGFLKANLSFTRISVRGNEKVENAKSSMDSNGHPDQNGSSHQKSLTGTIFKLFLASYVPASLMAEVR
ncbi:MAG TPA: transposase, partial [Virgibacillus sp.]|nr:transposase [Virgibacillus sp.]